MTPHQLKALQAIKRFIDQNGYSPSITDICKATGRNRSQVHGSVEDLCARGYLDRKYSTDGRALNRSITVTGMGRVKCGPLQFSEAIAALQDGGFHAAAEFLSRQQ